MDSHWELRQRCQIRLGHRVTPVRPSRIVLLSGGYSMTHGKCFGCLKPLFGGQVHIAQRFATQLIQAKKPRISQAVKLKLTLTDRPKKKKRGVQQLGRGVMGRIFFSDCWGAGRGLQEVAFITTISWLSWDFILQKNETDNISMSHL